MKIYTTAVVTVRENIKIMNENRIRTNLLIIAITSSFFVDKSWNLTKQSLKQNASFSLNTAAK